VAAEVGDESAVTAVLGQGEHEFRQRPPPSRRERRIAYWAMAAALVLHAVIIAVCIIDWAALLDLALAQTQEPDAIPVTLVYVPPPPPPPPPKPQPQPQVQPPQPQPQPAVAPRMSGTDEKTEAKVEDTPQPALPQPKSPPPDPAPQSKKQAPARAGDKEPAAVTAAPKSAEREAALNPEPRKEAPPGELFHSIRLPSQHGGTGERDTAGDAYLNRMRDLVERHRIYPPASAFLGGAERLTVYSILIDPAGSLVQITLLASSGSTVADEAAGNMIRSSAPFPPLPANYPHIRTLITVEMPIYPTPR
jgi:TonB family protein